MNYNPLIRPNKEIKYDTDEFSQPKKPRIISQLMQLPNCHVPLTTPYITFAFKRCFSFSNLLLTIPSQGH